MWNVVAFEHDEASAEIATAFLKMYEGRLTTFRSNHFPTTLKSTKEVINETKEASAVGTNEDKILTLYGYGGAHHYTYGLCYHVARPRTPEYLYVHIDNHSDSSRAYDEQRWDKKLKANKNTGRRILGCGSFTEEIRTIGAKDILYLGCPSVWGLIKVNWVAPGKLTDGRKRPGALKKALKKASCENVYISMDLDILARPEIETGFSRGPLLLDDLLKILSTINDIKNIIGADVLGYKREGQHSDCKKEPAHRYNRIISYLTYGIIIRHLEGKDYKEASKLRQKLISLNTNGKNGINAIEIIETLKI